MRVLIMGAGAVGGYCGAALAGQGHDVTFVARGAHLAALQARGLEVRSRGQTRLLQPVRAVDSPGQAGGVVDLVLFTVKGYDTDAAAAALHPALGPTTAVLTLQNGVDSADRLVAAVGREHVLPGTIMIWSVVASPGVIEETGPYCRVTFGELAGEVTARVESIATCLRAAGIEAVISEDALLAIWQKFVALAPHATITSACDSPVGPIRDTPEGMQLYRTLLAEAIAVGRAAGVALPENTLETTMGLVQSIPPTAKTSMQRDFEHLRRVELDLVTGTMVRRGRALGIPTPGFDALYAVLKVRAGAFGGLS